MADFILQGMGPADLIRAVCELTDYKTYLEKNKDQADHRLENVEELLTFATQAQEGAETTELSNILDRDEGTSSEDGVQQRAQAQAARILKYAIQETKKAQVQPEVIEIDSDSDDDVPKTISVKAKGKQKAMNQDGIAAAKPGEDDQPKCVFGSYLKLNVCLTTRPALHPCASFCRTLCWQRTRRQTTAMT